MWVDVYGVDESRSTVAAACGNKGAVFGLNQPVFGLLSTRDFEDAPFRIDVVLFQLCRIEFAHGYPQNFLVQSESGTGQNEAKEEEPCYHSIDRSCRMDSAFWRTFITGKQELAEGFLQLTFPIDLECLVIRNTFL